MTVGEATLARRALQSPSEATNNGLVSLNGTLLTVLTVLTVLTLVSLLPVLAVVDDDYCLNSVNVGLCESLSLLSRRTLTLT